MCHVHHFCSLEFRPAVGQLWTVYADTGLEGRTLIAMTLFSTGSFPGVTGGCLGVTGDFQVSQMFLLVVQFSQVVFQVLQVFSTFHW